MGGAQLTPQQAKNEVYAIAHEIINAIPAQVADIRKVGFYYESGNDDGTPPFRAVIGLPVTTHAGYNNDHLTDTYRDILLKLPGYHVQGSIHSHSPVIYKNDMFIYLPTHTAEAFEINGPEYVYEDMRKADPDPHALKEKWGYPFSATDSQDVTQDFLPPQKTSTQSSTPRHP